MNDENQATFGESGGLETPDSVESNLERYGIEANEPNRDTRIDRPEADTFGEPIQVENDPDVGEQSGLTGETDEQQTDLEGHQGVQTAAEWED